MDVLISRYIGIKGTAILARSRHDELIARYPEWFINEASKFDEDTKCMPEIDIALKNGALYAKEYTEFGVLEGLFSMSKELKCGLLIDIKMIPIKQETVEICEFVKANPYALYSGYSAIIVAQDGEGLKKLLEDNDISVQIVGHTTTNNDKILINEDEKSFIPHIRKDELKNILGRKEYYERTDFSHT